MLRAETSVREGKPSDFAEGDRTDGRIGIELVEPETARNFVELA
jgi:hypothetical protein